MSLRNGEKKSSKKLAQDPREAAGRSVDLDRFIFTALTVYSAQQFIFHSKGMLMPDFDKSPPTSSKDQI